MKTNPQDYQELLWQIQNNNWPRHAVLLPKEEKIYQVDLNARKIYGPEILSAELDHRAEIIYFKMNRFYDNMDLTNTVGIVQYVNQNAKNEFGAKDEGFIWVIPFYDTTTCAQLNPEEKDMVLFPWCIEGPATKAAGPVEFALRFYLLDEETKQYTFNLNTQPAVGTILHGMNVMTDNNENIVINDITTVEDLYQKIALLSYKDLYWIEA